MKVTVNFEKINSLSLEVSYKYENVEKFINFDVPVDFFITSDSLVALCIACRPVDFNFVSFNFDVSGRAKSILLKEFKINLVDTAHVDFNRIYGFTGYKNNIVRDKAYLSFSGGVDSMAAYYLCENNVNLLSIDFGGWFKREAEFFRCWNTKIVKTNFRDKPFSEKDWTFMAAGAILFADYLGIRSLLWGQVLEAAPWWFNGEMKAEINENQKYLVFNLSQISIGQVVAPLSEYGTTLISSSYGSQTLLKSIASAAESGSMKSFRKYLLYKIIYKEPIDDNFLTLHKLKVKGVSGKSFADDILGFYFAWKLGLDFVERHIMDLDGDFKIASKSFDMSFFEKYNPSNVPAIPTSIRSGVLAKFKLNGIQPYNEEDHDNLIKVRKYLASIYKFNVVL